MTSQQALRQSLIVGAASAVALTAALLYNGPGQRMFLLPVVIAMLLGWLTGQLWRDFGSGRVPYPSGPLPWLMTALLAWLLVSWTWSSWPQMSFAFAWMLGALPLGFLIWARQDDAERLWPSLWIALAAVTASAAVWGVGQYLHTPARVFGPLRDYNAYGGLLYAVFFPALAWYVLAWQAPGERFWRLRALEGFMAVTLLALFATYSRSAIGAWLVGTAAVLALAFVGRYRRVLAAATVVGILALGTYWAVKAYPDEPISRPVASAVANPASDPSTHHRLLMWQSAWEIYKDHPWLGTGLGTFKVHYAGHRSPDETGSAGNLAHNDYLQLLQEGGPVTLTLVLAAGLAALALMIRLLKGYRRAEGADRDRRFEGLALLLAVGGLFAQATITFILYMPPLALLMGLYIARARQLAGDGPGWRSAAVPVRGRLLKPAVVFVVALPVGTLAVDAAIAGVLLGQIDLPPAQTLREDRDARMDFARVMASLRPSHPTPHSTLGRAYQEAAEQTPAPGQRLWAGLAVDSYVAAARAQRPNPAALTRLGEVVAEYPEMAEGIPAGMPRDPVLLMLEAMEADPARPEPYLALTELLVERGQAETAYKVLTQRAPKWFGIPLSSRRGYEKRTELLVTTMELAHRLGHDDIARTYAKRVAPQRPDHDLAQRLAAEGGGS